MPTTRLWAMAVLGCLVCSATSWADDAADVLQTCRKAFENFHGHGVVTLERQGGTWKISGVNASGDLTEGRVPKVGGNWGSARPVSEAPFGPPSWRT